jgi:integrase
MFVPVLLAVMCGLRRGEITALCWRSVDLTRGQLSVAESTEQTTKGLRQKETKSGRSRTVALPSLVIEELRRRGAQQAEELLKVGVGITDQTYLVAREDGRPLQPNSLTHEFVRILAAICAAYDFMTFGIRTRPIFSRTASTRRLRKNALGIRLWA